MIGGQIAAGLAQLPVTLVLLCRSQKRGSQLVKVLAENSAAQIIVEVADLASPESIRAFAARLRDRFGRVDVLLQSASVVPTQRQVSPDTGLELQLQVNVLSYFLLMTELRPFLAAAAAGDTARIVNVCSDLAGGLDLGDLNYSARRYTGTGAYRQTKQAERMLTWEAARRFKPDRISVTACHPGITSSELNIALTGGGSGFTAHTPEQCAATPLRLATDPALAGVTGRWFEIGSGSSGSSREGVRCQFDDAQKCSALWEVCGKLVAASL